MKKTFLSLLLSLLFIIVNGQNHDLKVVINPAEDNFLLSEYDVVNKRQKPLLPDTAFDYNMYIYKRIYTPYIYRNTVVIVRLFDQTQKKLLKLREVDKDIKVKITIGGKEQIVIPTPDELDMTDFNLVFNQYFHGIELTHNSEVTIQVILSNSNYNFNNSPESRISCCSQ